MLTLDQNRTQVLIFHTNLDIFNVDPKNFRYKYLTIDKTYVFHFDLKSKRQNVEWMHTHLPPTRKFRVLSPAGKVTDSVFCENGVLLIDYVPRGESITANYYPNLITKLRDVIEQKIHGWARCIVSPGQRSHTQMRYFNGRKWLAPQDNPFSKRWTSDSSFGRMSKTQPKELYLESAKKLPHRYTKCTYVLGDYAEK